MANPTFKVELLSRSTSAFFNFFIIGESLIGGADVLAPASDVWADISDDVMSATISRGRSRDIDNFTAGTCTVRVKNHGRRFDPTNVASDLFGSIEPMRQLRVTATLGGVDYPLYRGFVQAWDIGYQPGDWSEVDIVCADAFSVLANQDMDSVVAAHDGDLPGVRMGRVLDAVEVAFPAGLRSLDAGLTVLGVTTFGENALGYLQRVAQSEPGDLFVTTAGALRFVERNGRDSTVRATFSDDGSDTAYVSIGQQFGVDMLHNRVRVSGVTGTVQTSSDTVSQATYQVRTLDRTGLLMQADAIASSQASFLLGRFAKPEFRFSEVTANVVSLSDARAAELLGLELADRVNVELTPPGGGSQIVQAAFIDRLSWGVSSGGKVVSLSASVSAGTSAVGFIIGDPQLGIIGTSLIAF